MTELLANSHSQNKKLVPIREAAKRVLYTTDYVARLAREGRIEAIRKGRTWLVELDSLKLFSLVAKAEAIRRQEELRLFRRQERIAAKHNFSETSKKLADPSLQHSALLESLVVVACLFLIVALSESALSTKLNIRDLQVGVGNIQGQFQQALALESSFDFSWPSWLWLWRFEKPKVLVDVGKAVTDEHLTTRQPLSENNKFLAPQIDVDTGLVLVSVAEVNVNVEYVADSFSDAVLVEFNNPQEGTITPNFLYSESRQYPFRLVQAPVGWNNE